jgi:Rrf2 family iron-sulfur cluster assembly transcriptional regulator
MRLTSKGRYAVRAMLDLTMHSNGNPVRLQEISTRQNISLHYLEQLFRKLRNGQAVKSVRGPGGGYVLARSMDQISMRDVLECVGENINPAKDILGTEAESSNTTEFHLSRTYFQNLGIIMKEYLTTTTLGDLARKSKDVEADVIAGEAIMAARNAEQAAAISTETSTSTTTETTSTPSMTSSMRSSIGEMNQ